jgi:mevalonate kinase
MRSLYIVSKNNTVISFYQNRKETGKIETLLRDILFVSVSEGLSCKEIYNVVKTKLEEKQAVYARGADKMSVCYYNPDEKIMTTEHPEHFEQFGLLIQTNETMDKQQRTEHVYIDRLGTYGGTFCSATEYFPLSQL